MDIVQLKCGAKIYPSKIISHPKGNILHGLKRSDSGFVDFGEVYLSSIGCGEIKGWKKHRKMTMNLLVPVGSIAFHFESDDGTLKEKIFLGESNYCRLFIPPDVWMAFEGVGTSLNLLMNIASIEHDPDEALIREFLR